MLGKGRQRSHSMLGLRPQQAEINIDQILPYVRARMTQHITIGNQENCPGASGRWQHEASAASRQGIGTRMRRKWGPATVTAWRWCSMPARGGRKTPPPGSKVAQRPRQAGKRGSKGGGKDGKGEAKTTTPHCLGIG